eukprot:6107054-Pleurochrysis_carterae.AAC.2
MESRRVVPRRAPHLPMEVRACGTPLITNGSWGFKIKKLGLGSGASIDEEGGTKRARRRD